MQDLSTLTGNSISYVNNLMSLGKNAKVGWRCIGYGRLLGWTPTAVGVVVMKSFLTR